MWRAVLLLQRTPSEAPHGVTDAALKYHLYKSPKLVAGKSDALALLGCGARCHNVISQGLPIYVALEPVDMPLARRDARSRTACRPNRVPHRSEGPDQLRHVTTERLRDVYTSLKRRAAPGVDGETWDTCGQDLEARLAELHGRVHRGAYRARASRRVYIPKPGGQKRAAWNLRA